MTENKLSRRLRTGVAGLAGLSVVSALGIALGLAPAATADTAPLARTSSAGAPAIAVGPVTGPTTAAPDARTSGS